MALERDAFPQDLKKSFHSEWLSIAKELFLRRLSLFLTDDSEFVGRDKYMFVIGDDEIWSSWADNRGKLFSSHVLVQ